jgi:hypothetical protein
VTVYLLENGDTRYADGDTWSAGWIDQGNPLILEIAGQTPMATDGEIRSAGAQHMQGWRYLECPGERDRTDARRRRYISKI